MLPRCEIVCDVNSRPDPRLKTGMSQGLIHAPFDVRFDAPVELRTSVLPADSRYDLSPYPDAGATHRKRSMGLDSAPDAAIAIRHAAAK